MWPGNHIYQRGSYRNKTFLRTADILLYLDRWRQAFDFPATGRINWPDWLRSRRNATHQRDLAQLIGQHVPIPSRLPFASIRFLPALHIATRAG